MRVEGLECFVEAARAGSFTAAANNLFISQQGLSRSIKSLEEEVGRALFSRAGRRVILTAAGETALPYAQRIVQQRHDMLAALREGCDEAPEGGEAFTLLTMSFASNVVLPHLQQPLEAAGLASTPMAELSFEEVVDVLLASADDPASTPGLALAVLTPEEAARVATDEELAFRPLFAVETLACATRDLVSPRRRSLAVEELDALPLAYFNEARFNRVVTRLFGGRRPKHVVVHSSNRALVDVAVREGRAVGLDNSFAVYLRDKTRGVMSFRIRDARASGYFGFLSASGAQPTDAQRRFEERFVRVLEQACPAYLANYPAPETAIEARR